MSTINNTINQKADQCVKCGLCLPHCPTYRLFEDENESPRGRIALIQGLANQQLHANHNVTRHINHCLGCRTCERVCPSGVDYGYLLDHSRQILNNQHARPGLQKYVYRTGLKLSMQKPWQRLLQNLLFYYQRSGFQSLLRMSGLLKLSRLNEIDRMLPKITRYRLFQTAYEGKTPTKGKVGLFTGCTGNLFDQQTLQDAISLLQKLGYEVVVPPQQTCCGALHQHQGQIGEASQLALQNIEAFANIDTIIYIASGCGAQLKDYPEFSWSDPQQSRQAGLFAERIWEICAFLAKEDLSQFHYRSLNQTVAIHTPCTLRNSLRQEDASITLLRQIPGVQLHTIPSETGCCGAAGSYMLSQPKLAKRIRQSTLDVIDDLNPSIVTTTNIGCRLHLNAGLSGSTRIVHPVSLLSRQLES